MFKVLVLVAAFTAIFYSIRGTFALPRSKRLTEYFTDSNHPENPCKYVLCPHGTHCVNKEMQCKIKHCSKIAVCLAQTRFPNFCGLPADEGRCPTKFTDEKRWFHNVTSRRCETFMYKGCHGNENNYLTYMHCERSCIRQENCFLKIEVGPCHASFERWYYNVFEGACQQFVYGGCQGNGNNFPTFNACMNKCFVAEFENPLDISEVQN